jgi:hypothetical protein
MIGNVTIINFVVVKVLSDWSEVTHNHILKKNNELTESFLEDQLGIKLLNKGISATEVLSFTEALTELSYDNYGRTPKRWIKASTKNVLEKSLPEKLALTAPTAKKAIAVLSDYVLYLEQSGYIKNGTALRDTIQETGMQLVSTLTASKSTQAADNPVETFMPHKQAAAETNTHEQPASIGKQQLHKKVISLKEVKKRRRLLKRRGRK